jgi:hypothetical protein
MNEEKLLAFLTCLLTDDKDEFSRAYAIGTFEGFKRRGRRNKLKQQIWRQVNGESDYKHKKNRGSKKKDD